MTFPPEKTSDSLLTIGMELDVLEIKCKTRKRTSSNDNNALDASGSIKEGGGYKPKRFGKQNILFLGMPFRIICAYLVSALKISAEVSYNKVVFPNTYLLATFLKVRQVQLA